METGKIHHLLESAMWSKGLERMVRCSGGIAEPGLTVYIYMLSVAMFLLVLEMRIPRFVYCNLF